MQPSNQDNLRNNISFADKLRNFPKEKVLTIFLSLVVVSNTPSVFAAPLPNQPIQTTTENTKSVENDIALERLYLNLNALEEICKVKIFEHADQKPTDESSEEIAKISQYQQKIQEIVNELREMTKTPIEKLNPVEKANLHFLYKDLSSTIFQLRNVYARLSSHASPISQIQIKNRAYYQYAISDILFKYFNQAYVHFDKLNEIGAVEIKPDMITKILKFVANSNFTISESDFHSIQNIVRQILQNPNHNESNLSFILVAIKKMNKQEFELFVRHQKPLRSIETMF